MNTVFQNARKADAAGIVDDFWMLVDGDTISRTGTGTAPEADASIDLGGSWLTPGFIDLHTHGGGGHVFDHGPSEMLAALAAHRARGTTRSAISLITNPVPDLCESLGVVAELAAADPLVLGSHLEGPFLADARRGAHNPEFLIQPEPAVVERLVEASLGTLRQITIAPELDGAFDAIDVFARAGVTVAVGHTEASFELAREAFDRGARLLTHVFNAMPGIHHRAPGPAVAAMADDRVTLELVLDGMHVHPDVAALAFAGAPGRIALVTDAMAAAGAADGHYRLGSLNVTVKEGLAVLSGTETIAGSTLTQDVALRIAIESLGLAPTVAIEALTATPARVLGVDGRFGMLAPGYAADAIQFDQSWRVQRVWADGRELETAA